MPVATWPVLPGPRERELPSLIQSCTVARADWGGGEWEQKLRGSSVLLSPEEYAVAL